MLLGNLYNNKCALKIRQRRNSDTDSNDNFHPHGVIFDEWEELEAFSSSNLIT
ncbi:hypothetical protein H8356DRAFT_1366497 [Neocallimastix lanati (nom. inval.)]|nr:hypothetical protein H8356DRAFT_1366497 [Neocallimastix sp. JGI-2020a]